MTPRRKILIVDDAELNLEMLEEVLADQYELRRAYSGEQALAALLDFPAELVLLDIVMPGMDGYETCRRITAGARTKGVKVILVSARGETSERLRGYQVGASDYVVKPFDPAELSAKVEVFLALKAAQDESRAKSEFVANISHEIRTPMTAILGYSENLRDGSLAEQARHEAVDAIWRNGQHLLDLINNILDISKIEANRLQIERMLCDPAEIVKEVAAIMRPRAEGKGLQFGVEWDGELPARMQSDRTRIKQILINLIGNAIKFTTHGSIRVVSRFCSDRRPEPTFEVDVIDTGIGIEAEQIPELCEPFVQADASITRRFGGTGLGLSISRRLAKLLGGDVTIRSGFGQGSQFTMAVAAGEIEHLVKPGCLQAARRSAVEGSESPLPRLTCRILLAEDGLDNQRLFTYVLEKAGAEVHVAENGLVAVDCVLAAAGTERAFDVVLMDMQMPVLDGYAATTLLRESGYAGPIIAVTAHAMAEDRQRCLAAGCNRFAAKPIDRQSLIRTIDELVRLA